MGWLLRVAIVVSLSACSSSSSTSTSSGGTATPTFRANINPIFSQSCALAACHGSSASNLGIYLPYDPDQAHASLLKESPTAKGAKFVVPGDPKNSYLQAKIDGNMSAFSAACGGCGAPMPLDLPQLSQAKRDLVRAWIQAGAKND